MDRVRNFNGFKVVTFIAFKRNNDTETQKTFDTKVFDKDDYRVGFFRKVIITKHNSDSTTQHIVMQPHDVLDQLGLNENDKIKEEVWLWLTSRK